MALKRGSMAGTRVNARSEDEQRQRQKLLEEALQLYERYGKPLERDHWGEYLAVSRDGRTVLGADLDHVSHEAVAQLGPGSFQFKVGDIAIWKVR